MGAKISHNIADLERDLSNAARSALPDALRKAINDTGRTMWRSNRMLIKSSFDRPTRFTLNSFRFRFASRTGKPDGELLRNDVISGKHYLEVQTEGGSRGTTGLERHMGSLIAKTKVGFVTPAKRAPLDGSGNLPRSELQRIYSQTNTQLDARNNETEASRKRKRKKYQYFVKPGGVFRREGRSLKKVLNLNVAQPRYRKRFDFYGRAERVAATFFPRNLARRMAEAMISGR